MKKLQLSVLLMLTLLASAVFTGCDKNPIEEEQPKPEELPFIFNKNEIGDGSQDYDVPVGTYILPKGTYVLKGWVSLHEGTTLTIEPGTVIKGDKATMASLIVQRGAKLIAQGTKEQPIVFTSNQPAGQRRPGDWGGIVMLGKAKNNQGTNSTIEGGIDATHGGDNDNDNSGILKYVRIEFPGYPFKPDNEINGLTLGSVGSGTKIEHVQVSYSNDDSYEWFGGTVNAKYLIAYNGWDDDFDTDHGFSGKLQYLLSIRAPKIADTSWSNGFESDNDGSGSSKLPFTSPVFSNVTFVGPLAVDANFQNTSAFIDGGGMNPNNGAKLGSYLSAMQVRRNSKLSIFNSVAIGYPVGLIIENDKGSTTQTWATNGDLKINNVYFAGMGVVGTDINKKTTDIFSTDGGATSDTGKPSFSTTYFKSAVGNKIIETVAELKLSPKWIPQTGSPLLSGAAFTDGKLSNGFDKVNFIGAFGTEDWTAGWANFNPQNTAY